MDPKPIPGTVGVNQEKNPAWDANQLAPPHHQEIELGLLNCIEIQ